MTRSLRVAPLLLLVFSYGLADAGARPRADSSLQVQTSPATPLRLVDVQVEGTARYDIAEVVAVSGLAIGQRLSPAELDQIAGRLASTGLFTSVRYRYRTSGDQITVTFEVQDSSWTIPVVLDNFVWFESAELSEAIRGHVPAWDGTVPADGRANAFVAASLEKIIADRGIQGRVEFSSRTNIRTGATQTVFRVADTATPLTVCALDVAAASAVSESDLQQAIAATIGDDYSRAFMVDLIGGTLLRIYHERGYWRAAFGDPVASLDETTACRGVRVTTTVAEGRPYAWQAARWTGVDVLDTDSLDDLMDIDRGDVADVTRIEAGLRRIESAYHDRGYLLHDVSFEPELDAATASATFVFAVTEGPQFRMGELTIEGLSENEAARFADDWDLETGDVYVASYLSKYLREDLRPRRPPVTEVRLDRERLLANVRIVVR